MSARDELAALLKSARWKYARLDPKDVYSGGMFEQTNEEVADAVLAAGYRKPRTITTAEELDALPDGSAVVDKEGDVLTKHAHWWHSYETAPLMSRKVAKYGPLTVIHEPDAD